MTLAELLPVLEGLSSAEKLHIIQHLAHDLETEETTTGRTFQPALSGEYKIWSPQDEGGTVATLHKLLQEHKQAKNAD